MVRFECPRHCAVGNALLQLLFDCGSASLQGDGFWHWPGNKGALVRPFASRATSGCIRIAQSRQSVASWSPWRTRGRNPYLGLRAEPALGAPCFGLKPKRLAGMELHAASKGPNHFFALAPWSGWSAGQWNRISARSAIAAAAAEMLPRAAPVALFQMRTLSSRPRVATVLPSAESPTLRKRKGVRTLFCSLKVKNGPDTFSLPPLPCRSSCTLPWPPVILASRNWTPASKLHRRSSRVTRFSPTRV